MRKFRSRATLFGALVVVAATLAGCGGSGTSTTGATTNATTVGSTTQVAAPAKAVPVALNLTQGSYSVSASGTTISGTASKGASVSVNGTNASVHAGHWHEQLPLHIGSNPVEVEATMSGRAPTTRVIHVVRHHNTAELETLAHEALQHAEAKHQLEAEAREHREHEAEARKRKEHEEAEKREHEQTPPQTECPNGTYENSAGNIVCKPYAPSNGEQPAGATAKCEDGTYSFSESRSGTCSHHGGVAEWLNG
jgi:Protein of unknown function (DUF3761)/Glucodextranase, domain B